MTWSPLQINLAPVVQKPIKANPRLKINQTLHYIDLIPKWPSFKYSFVFIQVSP